MQPVMGWCADRFGPARVLAAGFLLWSLATALTGLAGGLTALVALRLLMGVGEATFYPSALSLLSRNVPVAQRARATATMQFGALIGPAVGALLGGFIMVRYGWRAMFLVMGLASLVWLVFWRRSMRNTGDAARAAQAGDDPPYAPILKQRALWGGMIGTFCSNYAFYFVFSWLPLYLVNERGLSLAQMAPMTAAFYVADGASVLLTGWLLDRWVARGASLNRAYKTALAAEQRRRRPVPDREQRGDRGDCGGRDPAADRRDGRHQQPVQSVRDADIRGPAGDGTLDGHPERGRQCRRHVGPGRHRVPGAADRQLHLRIDRLRHVALFGLVAWLVIVPEVRPIDWAEQLRHAKNR